ncbi:MAG: tRNA (adenosine(37)-N6)-threonylcarbamoyltransferase complex transferase subunit TsaD [Frisingicoccus sp.]|uniref:tRNA (adenosine(37)-N6)-threonylcarbamoyltransferase complex transferase subunit TsaD n=1 Tax=Frisingicoccus sp. TaxID=1918627 RepID=UPI00260180F2|nr:tRNA (adenosine(37)-N6)-threonylcarbamoyltransferase complex transferase subunit TsaD [Frisingicoccus sp.]MDD6231151.1 tRNA (adenosine(37)-N6)-threonylcarbamoyltransferase complex transferase subunit TsaD [Frisingicoccus sp.]MDY4835837.1 tRNA (adenosine(37)-N6)-threonylcarbamoyltransferase complex transferase subunit TsaD [Frisingicoccus sp.]MDY5957118.1 tRNA (adenosine(37)-N6)-threonylcarbamoyltransferase complex transferase subunit TsaD [Frisingicoccus sp.]
MKKDIYILAIESSCDETAAAVVKNGREVLSNVISSQIELHKLYGGVVPEIASRKHIEKINPVIREALSDAGMTLEDMDAIGVTYGPGLVGALLVGVAAAKAISYAKNIPLVGVHHIEGHISANYIENKELEPPFLGMVVSGGHTHLVLVKDYGKYEILGRTRDDAAGEAFDKVARAIGLGYPGGPKIDKLAKEGDSKAIAFPRAHIADAPLDFSFSGLKSSVLNYINSCEMKHVEINRADVAASFQAAVVDAIVDHTIEAAKMYRIRKVALAGGVASNSALRQAMKERCEKEKLEFFYPSPVLCTDNAAMIGCAAYYEYLAGTRHGLDLNAVPNLKIGQR